MNEPTTTTRRSIPTKDPPTWLKALVWIAAAGLLLWAVGSCAASMTSVGSQAPVGITSGAAMQDVTVKECNRSDRFGLSKVTVRITNSTDRVQSYWVTVSVNDAAGNRLGEANGASNAVAPGQSANAELIGGATEGAANCSLASVNRIPS